MHRTVDLTSASVFFPLGTENVFQPNVLYAVEAPYQQAGPSALADFNHQTSILMQDRARLPQGITLQAGGRWARVTDLNIAKTAGANVKQVSRYLWLPQYAAAWTPPRIASRALTFYGNYGVLLSLGPQAPSWPNVDNASKFLQPYNTRQSEVGVKFEHGVLLTAAYFRMRQPYFYPRAITAADLHFESHGHETHDGVELAAQGKLAAWAQINASAAAMHAKAEQTLTAAFDGKQVLNAPKLRTAVSLDLAPAWTRGLHLLPGWSLASRKMASRDDVTSVGGYSLFNLGARWTPGGEQGHVTMRLYADNILYKHYWKDTGASYGDTFIHQGAPATVRASMHYSF
jgi:iron complex outermembrane receptor protein